MNLFGKKKHQRRTKTLVDPIAAAERKERKWASDRLLKAAANNPDLERAIIKRAIGIDLSEIAPDESEKRQFQSEVSRQSLELIKNDPELSAQLAKERAYSILGLKLPPKTENDGGDGCYSGNGGSLLDQVREVEELKRELGGNGGGLGSAIKEIITPEVIVAFLDYLKGTKNESSNVKTTKVYVVQVEGELREVDETQFKQLINQGALKPVAELKAPPPKQEPPKAETAPEIKEPEKPLTLEAKTISPEILALIESIGSMLELSPEDFVEQLENDETSQGKTIVLFLKNSDYNSIVKLITPYKDDPSVKYYADKIIKGQEWIDKVLALLKE